MRKITRIRLSVFLLTIVVAGFATLGHVASGAGPNTISLVSVNASSTGPGNFESRKTAISADGRFIAFTSSASNLTSDIDANDQPDVFLRDRSTNTTTLISRKLNSNTTGNESSGLLDIASTIGISADGRYIVYASRANDLIPSDNNGLADVFVYDRISAVNRLVSFKNADHSLPANGSSGSPVISANGQVVVFLSTASDLSITTDTNSLQDVYACYFNAGVIELVSINNAGAISGNAASSVTTPASISDDGRFVAFDSQAGDLVGNDSNGSGSFGTDVFVRDLQNNTTALATINAAGTGSGNLDSFASSVRISGNGRFVVFESRATDLVTGITDINGSFPDIFRRDLVAGTTQVVTVNVAGSSTGSDLSQFPAVSDDGRFVAFSSRSADLVPIDTNNGLGGGVTDVFVRDMQTGITKLVSMNSAGTDSGNSSSNGPVEISGNGRYVLFTSGATNLTTINDFNNNPDLLLRDVSTDTTTHVSVDRFGTAGAASSNNFSMNGSGSVVAFESQSGQIVNNDFNGAIDVFVFTLGSAPTLQFTTTQQSISEGTSSIQLTVTRSGDTSQASSVDYKTVDNDAFVFGCSQTTNNQALGRCDFSTAFGSLNFAANESEKTITLSIIDDVHVENSEPFSVQLSNATGATLGTPSTLVVTIQDNDQPNAANPILSTPFFVRQHYLDFLSREPELDGFNSWVNVLNNCSDVNNDPTCDRITVSSSFFGSPEFQLKGFFVFRFYKLGFNRLPQYIEITPDMSFVTGSTADEVFARKAQLVTNFTQREEFLNQFGALSNADYVLQLLSRYQLTQITTPDPANPDGTNKVTLTNADLLNRLANNTLTRAQVFRAIADSDEVGTAEFKSAFVAMQYYGYLRRTPEVGGYNDWLDYLITHPTDFRTMVNGFMNSVEYRLRFAASQ